MFRLSCPVVFHVTLVYNWYCRVSSSSNFGILELIKLNIKDFMNHVLLLKYCMKFIWSKLSMLSYKIPRLSQDD